MPREFENPDDGPVEDFWSPDPERRTWPATEADIEAAQKEAAHAEQQGTDSLHEELERFTQIPELPPDEPEPPKD